MKNLGLRKGWTNFANFTLRFLLYFLLERREDLLTQESVGNIADIWLCSSFSHFLLERRKGLTAQKTKSGSCGRVRHILGHILSEHPYLLGIRSELYFFLLWLCSCLNGSHLWIHHYFFFVICQYSSVVAYYLVLKMCNVIYRRNFQWRTVNNKRETDTIKTVVLVVSEWLVLFVLTI